MAAFGPLTILSVTAAALAMAAQQTRDTRPPTAPATISGRVTERGTERPIPHIVVAVEAPPSTRIETVTDGDGRYEIRDLAPGDYVLSAAPDRYRSTHLPMRHAEDAPVRYLASGARPNLKLKSGESRAQLDFALWRSLAIEGRVLDPWDQPMANVGVSVIRGNQSSGGGGDTTDDLGSFRIYGLTPGRYRVCANIGGDSEFMETNGLRLVRTCHVAALSESEGSDVVLASEDASGIDIRAQRVGSFTVSGSVVDSAGVPVIGAFVQARSTSDTGVVSSANTQAGQFTLRGLTPGRYLLTTSIGGAMRGDPNPPAREREAAHQTLDVQGDTALSTIVLAKSATVRGVVTFEGTPAPSTRNLRLIVLAPPEEESWSRSELDPPQTAVDDNLRFEFKTLFHLPRLVRLTNVPDGWVLKAVRYEGRDIAHTATDLGTARPDSRLEVVLTNRVARPRASVGGQGTFRVLVMPADAAIRKYNVRMVGSDQVRNGILELGAFVPGDYLVVALPDEDAFAAMRSSAGADTLETVATRVILRAGEEPTLDLPLSALPPKR